MKKILFGTLGQSPALCHARNQLAEWGHSISSDLTQVTHLLLPVPSLDDQGNIRGGISLTETLARLRPCTQILGGNLPPLPIPAIDLLQDEYYLAENAAITAQCAMRRLESPAGKQVLVIGMGRIGSILGKLLQKQGAAVTMAVRSPEKVAFASEKGFAAAKPTQLDLTKFDCVFNTAPEPVMDQSEAAPNALLIDLASRRGISGDRVDWARALPGKEAPQQSGSLIAKTALRYALKKEVIS